MDLAEAAMEEGADGLKFHINVHHRASGNDFQELAQYEALFRNIRARFSGPLGIVPGGSMDQIHQGEIERLEQIGFDFTSVFAQHMPSFLMHRSQLASTFAVDTMFQPDLLEQVAHFPITAVEASVIPPEGYGAPLNFKDLLLYRQLGEKSGKPIIVPSQRNIKVHDITALADSGISALLIGAIVTGRDVNSLRQAVAAFRNEIDKL